MELLIIKTFMCVIAISQIQGKSLPNIQPNEGLISKSDQYTKELPEDVGLDIEKYLQKYNYPIETHQVITDDGFILTLHRIPAANSTNSVMDSSKKAPAALFAPGISCTSIDWVNLGPGRALGLLMSDLGYDIWLLNPRGTRYSMKHQTLNSSAAEFWDFSFHEKGYYDLVANIDYVLAATGWDKITVIGHSEGTSASMVLTTTKPEYNDKINLMVMLSPIGYMGGVTSPIPLIMTKYMTELKLLMELLNAHGFPYSEELSNLIAQGCNMVPQACAIFLQTLVGYDPDQIDMDFLIVFLSDKPNGIAVKQVVHYGQEIITDTFKEFDYGIIGNLLHYGNSVPPAYDVSKITTPVAAYYAQNDFFANMTDVEKLLSEMPNVVDKYLVDYELFNHLDFITAKDVKDLLYDRLLETINKYNL